MGALAPIRGRAATAFGGAKPEADAIMSAYATTPVASVPAQPAPTPPAPASPPAAVVARSSGGGRNDVLDAVAKLSELHKSGAVTDAEFQREKSKLLAEL